MTMETFNSSTTPEIPLDMYAVSGHGEVNPQAYLESKKQDESIKAAAEHSPEAILRRIYNAPKENWAELIWETLETGSADAQEEVMGEISSVPAKDRARLIKKALSIENIKVQKTAAGQIVMASKEEEGELRQIVSQIIDRALTTGDEEQQRVAVEMIWTVTKEERASLFKKAFQTGNIKVQLEAACNIDSVPGKDTEELRRLVSDRVRSIFATEGTQIKKEAAAMILATPTNEAAELIRLALKEEVLVQKEAIQTINHAPQDQRAALIKEAFSKQDIDLFKTATLMLKYTEQADFDELRLLVVEKIEDALATDDLKKQMGVAELIKWVPQNEAIKLNLAISQKIREAFGKGLGDEIVQPPLYNKHPNLNHSSFRREAFSKSGSETTLVSGSLKDKIIVRHIQPEAFLTWQRAYENHQTWKDNGFDYVPIEPIQSYRLNKEGLVDVYSGVLDLNLKQWLATSCGMFSNELGEQRKKIDLTLNKMGIEHGHTHSQNYVLRFFRDEQGHPDITRVPRLYLIDFDQATSPGR